MSVTVPVSNTWTQNVPGSAVPDTASVPPGCTDEFELNATQTPLLSEPTATPSVTDGSALTSVTTKRLTCCTMTGCVSFPLGASVPTNVSVTVAGPTEGAAGTVSLHAAQASATAQSVATNNFISLDHTFRAARFAASTTIRRTGTR